MELASGDSFGEMEVTSLSNNEIKMKNEDDISLVVTNDLGRIQIQVADDSTLRFAQYLTPLKKEFMNCGTVYDKDIDRLPSSRTPL